MKSKTIRHLLAALLLLLFAAGTSTASASVLLLVHGYLGDGQSFHRAGVIPALESAHALAWVMREAERLGKDTHVLINLSGRGDKDADFVADKLNL